MECVRMQWYRDSTIRQILLNRLALNKKEIDEPNQSINQSFDRSFVTHYTLHSQSDGGDSASES